MRRPIAVLALALTLGLVATACGSSADTDGDATPSRESDATDTADTDTAESDDTDTTGAADTRVVSHDQGETEVPTDPQRVVVLDTPHLDTALSLGITPIAAVSVFGDGELPGYVGDRTSGIEVVGSIAEPNLEAIAGLEPDLILSATVRHEAIYEELSQIAPTVFTESSGTDWQVGFTLVAEALGQADEGTDALAAHEDRVTSVGEQLGAAGRTATIVRFLPEQTRIYGPDTFSGSVLTDVGFELPDLDYDEFSMAYISAEQFEQADAEVIYTSTYGDPVETTQSAVTELWGNLDAVASGCQFPVEDDEWMIGIGLIGANIILDDLETTLEGTDCLGG